MLTGYIIYRVKEPPKISIYINLFLWIISFLIMFFVIFGVWKGSLSLEVTALYISLSHTGLYTHIRAAYILYYKSIFN